MRLNQKKKKQLLYSLFTFIKHFIDSFFSERKISLSLFSTTKLFIMRPKT
jgi:hypothetical protein